jgi:hypothetical protein
VRGQVKPKPVAITACCSVVGDEIVWVCYPESGRRSVGVKQRICLACDEAKVVMQCILRLDTVFHEERVAKHVIRHCVFQPEPVDAVDRNGSVERMMN